MVKCSMYKKIVSLFLLILLIFLSSCFGEEKGQYLFRYDVNGNGTISCEIENDKYYDGGKYVYILAIPFEGEDFLSWTINGEKFSDNTGVLIELNKDLNIIANFSTNTNEVDSKVDMDHIYAYLPEDWVDVKMSIYHMSKNKTITIDMEKEEDYWSCSLVDNNISKTAIKTICFKSENNSTQTYEYDSEYNFFNYVGLDRDGFVCGGFSNNKCDMIKISVLEMNDLHGYISQSSEGKAGLSNASFIINRIRIEDDEDNVLLVGNGDMFQGTAISNLNKGLTVIECMNQMEFDFLGIGNHEFDWNINTILKYFDGDQSNGEANFPLINSNIVVKETGELLSGENVLASSIINKNGIKIGVLSLIGDVKSSINQIMVKDYDFLSTSLCEAQAIELKNQGADIIVVNVHGADTEGVDEYYINKYLASLSYNGEWLVDCIINGHSHTNQEGFIKRAGQNLPIVQGGSYCYYVGQIDLYLNKNTKEVTTSRIITNNVSLVGTSYDRDVQKIIDDNYELVKEEIEEVYCVSAVDVHSKSNLQNWISSVMLEASGCDVSICNNGGIRSTGNIKEGSNIGLEEMYMINPFDNTLVIVEISGKDLYAFLNRKNTVFYGLKDGLSLSSLRNENKKYKLVVIDYVYYWDDFPRQNNDQFTDYILRDTLIEDLRLRTYFDPYNDYNAYIGLLIK